MPTPPPRKIALITIPAGVRVSEVAPVDVPRWDHPDQLASRAAGDAWLHAARTVALIVPSKSGAPLERNVMFNPGHPDARRLDVSALGSVPWNLRLFEDTPAARTRPIKRTGPRKKK